MQQREFGHIMKRKASFNKYPQVSKKQKTDHAQVVTLKRKVSRLEKLMKHTYTMMGLLEHSVPPQLVQVIRVS